MPRPLPLLALIALIAAVIASGSWVARTQAQMATPATESGMMTLILVEHAELVTEVDLGEPGPTIGDMLVWGPNALYDEANANDTGATTQGACIAFNAASDCIASETIVFPDGSTLEFQGIERGGGVPSVRTIVGGSGRYLGATGTMEASPSTDLTLWTKTIEIAAPRDEL
jgi:hypothetical protein